MICGNTLSPCGRGLSVPFLDLELWKHQAGSPRQGHTLQQPVFHENRPLSSGSHSDGLRLCSDLWEKTCLETWRLGEKGHCGSSAHFHFGPGGGGTSPPPPLQPPSLPPFLTSPSEVCSVTGQNSVLTGPCSLVGCKCHVLQSGRAGCCGQRARHPVSLGRVAVSAGTWCPCTWRWGIEG